MQIAGYLASLFVGISLGLIGGGGSIITVPVLVYLFGLSAPLATYYSMFVVGISSLVGTWPKYFKGFVHLQTAWLFGIPSIIGVLVVRRLLLPNIPDQLLHIGSHFVLTKPLLMMVVFAIMMLIASVAMIKGYTVQTNAGKTKQQAFKLVTRGVLVGAITGFVGVGGGFLIIPSLVVVLGFSMKNAIGTSLFIIAINSLLGFAGDVGNYPVQWRFLLSITGVAVLGIFLGNFISQFVEGEKLKKGFGWFILVMGCYILFKELINK